MNAKESGSVFLREPRETKTPRRSREQIVSAAIELLDADGIDALSMRKLGAKLGAGATSLYWYVENKEQLLELALDEIYGELASGAGKGAGTGVDADAGTGERADAGSRSSAAAAASAVPRWRAFAAGYAHGMRAMLLRHPWGASLIGYLPSFGPNALAVGEELRAAFAGAGFDGLEINYASSVVTAYAFGTTVPELALVQKGRVGPSVEGDGQKPVPFPERLVAELPDLASHYEAMARTDTQTILEQNFAFGLACILDGLEARLA